MSESEQRSGDVFDLEQLRRLVELMDEKDLSEIDLRQLDQRIRLTRGPLASGPVVATHLPAPVPPSPATPTPTASPDASNASADAPGVVLVKSPMVGTYYSKPNPEAANYVNVGDRVSADTTICIIEAMKVFNEIPAEVSGEVIAVLLENEDPVEFGTPLFKVDTSK